MSSLIREALFVLIEIYGAKLGDRGYYVICVFKFAKGMHRKEELGPAGITILTRNSVDELSSDNVHEFDENWTRTNVCVLSGWQ